MACPTSETKVSLFLYEMEFFGLNFYRKYVPENSEPDEPIKPIPVTVKVRYIDRIVE